MQIPRGESGGPDMESISIVLDGGLANQLFQRVASLVLESRFGVPARFSTGWLGRGKRLGVTPRHLEIAVDISELDRRAVPSRIAVHAARRLGRSPRSSWLIERSSSDDPLERWNPSQRFAFGFFQRLDYVQEVWHDLSDHLSRSPQTRSLLSAPSRHGIALHYRLGDYVSNPRARGFHGETNPAYYVAATQRLLDEGVQPMVTLVSDEPAEAQRRLIDAGMPVSITMAQESTSGGPWDDLTILAGSDAVIMSNSSFSWWGAYLAWRTHDARVVSPTPWFANSSTPAPKLLPEAWTVLQRGILP